MTGGAAGGAGAIARCTQVVRGARALRGAHCVAPALRGVRALGTARVLLAACLVLAAAPAAANGSSGGAAWGDSLVGERFVYEVRRGDSLGGIAARHGTGAALIARDNAIGPRQGLKPGQQLMLETRHIVPQSDGDGITINVPQRMLFHFEGGALRTAYPVTAGRPDWQTPLGPFTVVNRQTDKPWFVPKSIQEEMRQQGKPVLTRVEPGPDNPLGRHWIGLSMPAIGIHGTNAPTSIYALRSHGCVRMHPDAVADLFERVRVGDAGRIVYHPALLAGLPDGRVFVEVHLDAYRRSGKPIEALRALAAERGIESRIDWLRVAEIVAARDGVAREVTLPDALPAATPLSTPTANPTGALAQ